MLVLTMHALHRMPTKPVHLIVAGEDFILEETTEDVIAEKLADRMSRPLISLSWEPESELRSYDELATTSPTRRACRIPSLWLEGCKLGVPRPSRGARSDWRCW
jgi:hypothetical protein